MALQDLTQADFAYYKKMARDMKSCHEKEFLRRIDPQLMRAFYRGLNTKHLYEDNLFDQRGFYNDKDSYMSLSRIFQATNTILPNLYYQNPSPIVIGKREGDDESAALMSALLKYYMKLNNAKRQNQEAVMNAWFFGIGWKKLGYRTVFFPKERIAQEPESILTKLQGGINNLLGVKPDNTESKASPDIVDYEQLFNNVESPMNVMLDHKNDLLNCKAILHQLPRTLYDIQNYGDYDEVLLDELHDKMKYDRGSRLDTRDIVLTFNELHIQQRNGVWILSWVDEFEKALRYDKSTYDGKGFQFEPLVFTNEPGVRYPTSHMRVASQVQEKLDDQASLFLDIVSRIRNQVIINEKALSPGQKKAIEENRTGGIIWTQKDVSPSLYAQLTSASVSNDLPMLMTLVQQNITELLGADEQMVGGNSKNKTLGQDELARVGSKIRETGMQDKVRDWMVAQFEKEGAILKQYSNAQLNIQITGKDYADPKTGMLQEEKWAEFMSMNNPLGAKNYLKGEYDYDVNIYEAMKPDKKSIQAECFEAIQIFSNPAVQDAMLQTGSRPRIDKLAEKAADNFEFIKSGEFIEQLDSMQVAAIQTQKILMSGGGQLPQEKQRMAMEAKKNEKPAGEPVSNRSSVEASQ